MIKNANDKIFNLRQINFSYLKIISINEFLKVLNYLPIICSNFSRFTWKRIKKFHSMFSYFFPTRKSSIIRISTMTGGRRGRLLIHRSNGTINNRIDDKREEWARKKAAMGETLARIVSVKQKYWQIQKEKNWANWRVLNIAFDMYIYFAFPSFFPNSARPIISPYRLTDERDFQSNLLRWINLEVDQFQRIESFHPSRERIFRQLILIYWKLNKTFNVSLNPL